MPFVTFVQLVDGILGGRKPGTVGLRRIRYRYHGN